MTDCFFISGRDWFRYRAVGIIIEDNEILLATNNEYIYSIGGGIHINETAEDAVVREVYEESGIHYEVEKFIGIHENFFRDPKFGDYDCHEVAMYFLMKPQGKKIPTGDREGIWIPIHQLKNYKRHIDFIELYLNSDKEFIHLVTKDYD